MSDLRAILRFYLGSRDVWAASLALLLCVAGVVALALLLCRLGTAGASSLGVAPTQRTCK